MSPDKNVEAVRAKLLERSHAVLAKYGVTTERTDTDLVGWLNHLQEELMDAAVYVQRSMVEIEAREPVAELESLRAENALLKSSGIDKVVKIIAETEVWKECETLRARLAELEKQKQEPVGDVSAGTFVHWANDCVPACGTKLYAAPVVSPGVEKLIADHNSDMAACHEQFMDVSREVMSLKTELEAARKDATEAGKKCDGLVAALERAETAMEICSDWMTEIEMPDGWTTTTDEKLKISAAIEQASSCNELHEKGGM